MALSVCQFEVLEYQRALDYLRQQVDYRSVFFLTTEKELDVTIILPLFILLKPLKLFRHRRKSRLFPPHFSINLLRLFFILLGAILILHLEKEVRITRLQHFLLHRFLLLHSLSLHSLKCSGFFLYLLRNGVLDFVILDLLYCQS